MQQLSRHIDAIGRIPSRVAPTLSAKLSVLLADQFEAGVDPYGTPWPQLAERTLEKHGEPPLQGEFGERPGDMAEGTFARPASGAGVEIVVPFPGGIHQTGASREGWSMPKRSILPDQRALPPSWKAAIEESIREVASADR
jgi:hypothetical protein